MSGERIYGRDLHKGARTQPLLDSTEAKEKTVDLEIADRELPDEFMVSPPICDESIDLLAAYFGFKDPSLPERHLETLLMRILVCLAVALAIWQGVSWFYTR